MGAIEGFLSTWSQAHAMFGRGAPAEGAQFDQSSQLLGLRDSVTSARPDSAWTGSASDSYAEANSRQGHSLGSLADLDKRLGVEVDRSAAVVIAGRRDLDAVRKWVVDAAATIPDTAAGQRQLYPVIAKGSGEIADIIGRSHGDLAAIAARIRGLGGEYQALGGGGDADADAVDAPENDGEEGTEVPNSTLDLEDIVYTKPGELGPTHHIELVPGSGAWVPDYDYPGYQPKPPKAPLDLDDIDYRGPGALGEPWQMELVPGSGAWVPDPHHPGYQPHTPEAPVDLDEVEFVDPEALVPSGMIELWPRSGIIMPDPNAGAPF